MRDRRAEVDRYAINRRNPKLVPIESYNGVVLWGAAYTATTTVPLKVGELQIVCGADCMSSNTPSRAALLCISFPPEGPDPQYNINIIHAASTINKIILDVTSTTANGTGDTSYSEA